MKTLSSTNIMNEEFNRVAMSALECASRAPSPSTFSCPTLLDSIGSKATASPGFTFSAHRPTKSVMKDGSSKRFRSEDFAPPEGDDGGMD
ncbi:hypothetical protein L3X38_006981 [Prunus dulcis]|uniref:Uncharacterized protein n=1 Tax=Prunus dulcis TaxID=3755 RepID=A0AAD4ZTT8_PRUDU|nr:hypothetical protein L3X38_006981 [Prunus dulcis]